MSDKKDPIGRGCVACRADEAPPLNPSTAVIMLLATLAVDDTKKLEKQIAADLCDAHQAMIAVVERGLRGLISLSEVEAALSSTAQQAAPK